MATCVRIRGGTTSQHSNFTGAAREITVDTTKKTVVVHDGSTAGGTPLATEDGVKTAITSSDEAMLLNDRICNTTAVPTFDDNGEILSMTHSRSGTTLRTDTFTYPTSTSIIETRVLSNGKSITITYNSETFSTSVSNIS